MSRFLSCSCRSRKSAFTNTTADSEEAVTFPHDASAKSPETTTNQALGQKSGSSNSSSFLFYEDGNVEQGNISKTSGTSSESGRLNNNFCCEGQHLTQNSAFTTSSKSESDDPADEVDSNSEAVQKSEVKSQPSNISISRTKSSKSTDSQVTHHTEKSKKDANLVSLARKNLRRSDQAMRALNKESTHASKELQHHLRMLEAAETIKKVERSHATGGAPAQISTRAAAARANLNFGTQSGRASLQALNTSSTSITGPGSPSGSPGTSPVNPSLKTAVAFPDTNDTFHFADFIGKDGALKLGKFFGTALSGRGSSSSNSNVPPGPKSPPSESRSPTGSESMTKTSNRLSNFPIVEAHPARRQSPPENPRTAGGSETLTNEFQFEKPLEIMHNLHGKIKGGKQQVISEKPPKTPTGQVIKEVFGISTRKSFNKSPRSDGLARDLDTLKNQDLNLERESPFHALQTAKSDLNLKVYSNSTNPSSDAAGAALSTNTNKFNFPSSGPVKPLGAKILKPNTVNKIRYGQSSKVVIAPELNATAVTKLIGHGGGGGGASRPLSSGGGSGSNSIIPGSGSSLNNVNDSVVTPRHISRHALWNERQDFVKTHENLHNFNKTSYGSTFKSAPKFNLNLNKLNNYTTTNLKNTVTTTPRGQVRGQVKRRAHTPGPPPKNRASVGGHGLELIPERAFGSTEVFDGALLMKAGQLGVRKEKTHNNPAKLFSFPKRDETGAVVKTLSGESSSSSEAKAEQLDECWRLHMLGRERLIETYEDIVEQNVAEAFVDLASKLLGSAEALQISAVHHHRVLQGKESTPLVSQITPELEAAKDSPRFREAMRREGINWFEFVSETNPLVKTKLLTDLLLERSRVIDEINNSDRDKIRQARMKFRDYIDVLNDQEARFLKAETRRQETLDRYRQITIARREETKLKVESMLTKDRKVRELEKLRAVKYQEWNKYRTELCKDAYNASQAAQAERLRRLIGKKFKTEEKMREFERKRLEQEKETEVLAELKNKERELRYKNQKLEQQKYIDSKERAVEEKFEKSQKHQEAVWHEMRRVKHCQDEIQRQRMYQILRLDRKLEYQNYLAWEERHVESLADGLKNDLKEASTVQRRNWLRKKEDLNREGRLEMERRNPGSPGPGCYSPGDGSIPFFYEENVDYDTNLGNHGPSAVFTTAKREELLVGENVKFPPRPGPATHFNPDTQDGFRERKRGHGLGPGPKKDRPFSLDTKWMADDYWGKQFYARASSEDRNANIRRGDERNWRYNWLKERYLSQGPGLIENESKSRHKARYGLCEPSYNSSNSSNSPKSNFNVWDSHMANTSRLPGWARKGREDIWGVGDPLHLKRASNELARLGLPKTMNPLAAERLARSWSPARSYNGPGGGTGTAYDFSKTSGGWANPKPAQVGEVMEQFEGLCEDYSKFLSHAGKEGVFDVDDTTSKNSTKTSDLIITPRNLKKNSNTKNNLNLAIKKKPSSYRKGTHMALLNLSRKISNTKLGTPRHLRSSELAATSQDFENKWAVKMDFVSGGKTSASQTAVTPGPRLASAFDKLLLKQVDGKADKLELLGMSPSQVRVSRSSGNSRMSDSTSYNVAGAAGPANSKTSSGNTIATRQSVDVLSPYSVVKKRKKEQEVVAQRLAQLASNLSSKTSKTSGSSGVTGSKSFAPPPRCANVGAKYGGNLAQLLGGSPSRPHHRGKAKAKHGPKKKSKKGSSHIGKKKSIYYDIEDDLSEDALLDSSEANSNLNENQNEFVHITSLQHEFENHMSDFPLPRLDENSQEDPLTPKDLSDTVGSPRTPREGANLNTVSTVKFNTGKPPLGPGPGPGENLTLNLSSLTNENNPEETNSNSNKGSGGGIISGLLSPVSSALRGLGLQSKSNTSSNTTNTKELNGTRGENADNLASGSGTRGVEVNDGGEMEEE